MATDSTICEGLLLDILNPKHYKNPNDAKTATQLYIAINEADISNSLSSCQAAKALIKKLPSLLDDLDEEKCNNAIETLDHMINPRRFNSSSSSS